MPTPETGKSNSGNGSPLIPDLDIEARFLALHRRHPGSKSRIQDCRSHYTNLVLTSVDPLKTADSIDAKHAAWIEYWRKSEAIPLGLFNFLAARDCLEDPPAAAERNGQRKTNLQKILEEL